MSVRSRTKGKKPPRPRRQNYAAQVEFIPEMISLFMIERAESERRRGEKMWEARKDFGEKKKIREASHLQSTTTWKRKSYAH